MFSTILLQTQTENSGAMVNILMIVLLVAIFYFFMIRPQQKKQKEIRKFRESLTEGDRVVTAGGIYGKIKKIKDTTFIIQVADGVCITVDKGSVYPSAEEAKNDAEAEEKKIKN